MLFTINIKGKIVDFSTPQVMGILNITPDSFYDGKPDQSIDTHINKARKMIEEGAQILDLGACSTRPNADLLNEEEEWRRLKPVLEAIRARFPEIIISIDTFRANIARKAVEGGADLINDISGGTMDVDMFKTIAKLDVPYVLMHIQGTPQTMLQQTSYENLFSEITHYFSEKVNQLRQMGVKDIILDPGFGFAKTLAQNFELFDYLEFWKKSLGCPVLVGISRKSMIYKIVNTSPEGALNGTTVLNTMAMMRGANILRVHDVKEALEVIKLDNRR